MSMPGSDMRPDDGAVEYDGHEPDDCPECGGTGHASQVTWWEPEYCTCPCHLAEEGDDAAYW